MANTKGKDTKEPRIMSFSGVRDFFMKLDQERAVAGRLGIYTALVIYKNALYKFRNIKMNASDSTEIFGFGLNHYFWLPGNHIANMPTKSSMFHDSEDVSIDLRKEEFVSAELSTGRIRAFKDGPFVTIETKKYKAIVSWE